MREGTPTKPGAPVPDTPVPGARGAEPPPPDRSTPHGSGSPRARRRVGPAVRLDGFDGLRALSALCVVLFHAHGKAPIPSAAVVSILPGLRGVAHVFFILSAFLLYRPFVRAHLRGEPQPGLRRYFSSRFLRIMPVYWLCLVLATMIGTTQVHGLKSWLVQGSLLQIYSGYHTNMGLVVSWTLSVDVAFYVLLPIYAFGVQRLMWRGTPIVREMVGGLLMIAGGLVYQSWAVGYHDTLVQYWPPYFFPVFGVGFMVAAVFEWQRADPQRAAPVVGWLSRLSWLWASLFVVCVYLGSRVGAPAYVFVPLGNMPEQMAFLGMAAFSALAVAFPGRRRGPVQWIVENRPIVWLGATATYGMYLFHVSALIVISQRWLGWPVGTGNFFVVFPLGLAAAIGFGAVTYHLVERPARLLNTVPGRAELREDLATLSNRVRGLGRRVTGRPAPADGTPDGPEAEEAVADARPG